MKRSSIVICLFFYLNLFSQEFKLPEIFPASPTASELGKFGSYPVNLSSGLPQIEIPLYTIQSGDLKIPIKLKYHASGIKVNQMSSWVGLGWSIDTGGIISLETRDTPDELEPNPYDIPNLSDLENIIFQNPYNFQEPTIKNILQNSWVKDAFHINLPTVNGTFFLNSDNNGEVLEKFPPDEFQIFRNNRLSENDNYYYKIVDKTGIQYLLKDVEYSRLNKTNNDDGGDYHVYNTNYKSAWLLNKIIDNKGNNVEYQYGAQYESIVNGESHSQSYSYTISNGSTYSASIQPWKKNRTSSTSFANKLQEILFTNGRLRFIMASNSQFDGVDGEAGKYLDKIIVERGDATSGYSELKTIHFVYSITGAGNYYTSESINKYRFKLDRVYETFGPSPEKNVVNLDYSTVQLPNSKSYSLDYFGYFNDKINTNLIPQKNIQFNHSATSSQTRQIGLADRSIDVNKMKAGMLTKITYPTKGYTTFEFEPNSFFGKNMLKDLSVNHSLDLIGEGDGSVNPIPCLGDCWSEKHLSFNVGGNTNLSLNGSLICNNCDPENSKYSFAKISVMNNGIEKYSFTGYTNNLSEEMVLETGSVFISLEIYGSTIEGHLQVSYRNTFENLPNENVQSFGLRVKNITNYNHDNEFVSKKEYQYLTPNTSDSSGKLINNDSKYDRFSSFKSFNLTGCGPTNYSETDTFTYTSSSNTGFENNGISYEYVTELETNEEGSTNGKTEYKYTTMPNYIVDGNAGTVWLNLGNKRGELLIEEIFDKNNKILTKEENYYSNDLINKGLREEFKAYKHFESNTNTNTPCISPPFDLESSIELLSVTLQSNWSKKDTSIISKYYYDRNGNLIDTMITTTNYIYNTYNQEVEKETVTNSRLEILERNYKYAKDLNIQTLIDANRIAVPVEITTLNNTTIINNQYTKYDFFGNLYQPSEVFIKKGSNVDLTKIIDRKIVYDSYDSIGNITQYHSENGPYTSIVWGYNNEYPVAEIKNAIYNDVITTGVDLNKLKSLVTPESERIDELQMIRNGLPNALVTSYTYDPLLGITSITDPRGETIYYEYDDFNRLKFVKDTQRNILSKNEYKYKNQ